MSCVGQMAEARLEAGGETGSCRTRGGVRCGRSGGAGRQAWNQATVRRKNQQDVAIDCRAESKVKGSKEVTPTHFWQLPAPPAPSALARRVHSFAIATGPPPAITFIPPASDHSSLRTGQGPLRVCVWFLSLCQPPPGRAPGQSGCRRVNVQTPAPCLEQEAYTCLLTSAPPTCTQAHSFPAATAGPGPPRNPPRPRQQPPAWESPFSPRSPLPAARDMPGQHDSCLTLRGPWTHQANAKRCPGPGPGRGGGKENPARQTHSPRDRGG